MTVQTSWKNMRKYKSFDRNVGEQLKNFENFFRTSEN